MHPCNEEGDHEEGRACAFVKNGKQSHFSARPNPREAARSAPVHCRAWEGVVQQAFPDVAAMLAARSLKPDFRALAARIARESTRDAEEWEVVLPRYETL